jgi:hypothetical protein
VAAGVWPELKARQLIMQREARAHSGRRARHALTMLEVVVRGIGRGLSCRDCARKCRNTGDSRTDDRISTPLPVAEELAVHANSQQCWHSSRARTMVKAQQCRLPSHKQREDLRTRNENEENFAMNTLASLKMFRRIFLFQNSQRAIVALALLVLIPATATAQYAQFSTWLIRITINESLMKLREQRSTIEVYIDGDSQGEEVMAPLELVS